MFCVSIAIVGTNLNASENENAYSYGIFIEIRESAKSFGSTVKKKIENVDTMINILKIIAIAKDNDINNVFKIIMKINKKDKVAGQKIQHKD